MKVVITVETTGTTSLNEVLEAVRKLFNRYKRDRVLANGDLGKIEIKNSLHDVVVKASWDAYER